MQASNNPTRALFQCKYGECNAGLVIDLNTEFTNIDSANCPLTVEVLNQDCTNPHGMDTNIVIPSVADGILTFAIT